MATSELPSPPRPSDAPKGPSHRPSSLRVFAFTWIPFALSALWVAFTVHLVLRDVRYLVPIALVTVVWILPLYLRRRRQRAILLGGDVQRVIDAWGPSLDRAPNAATIQPLMIATAYAANGWTEAARDALARADRRGATQGIDGEERLVVSILLDTFEGERDRAVREAERLQALPLPAAGIFLRGRISMLRAGLAAFARAFHRSARADDLRLLESAAKSSPLLHWAFTYAAAVVAIDQGHRAKARALLDRAPAWSESSVFAAYHRELLEVLSRPA